MYAKLESSDVKPDLKIVRMPDDISRTIAELTEPEDFTESSALDYRIDLTKARQHRRNLEIMRTEALYIVEITVHVGRGASAIRIDFEDLGLSASSVETLKAERVKAPQIVPFEKLKDLAGELHSKRAKIQDQWMFYEQRWFVPEKFLESVADGIEEMFQKAEELRNEAIAAHSEGKRDFLNRLARIAISSGSTDVERVLKRYASEFPAKAEIVSNFGVSVSEMVRLPSIVEQATTDAQLATAEAEFAEAQVKLHETEAVRKLQSWYFNSIRDSLSQTVESARDKFYGIIADMLKDINRIRAEGNVSPARERKLDRGVKDIQKLFEAINFEMPLSQLAQQVEQLKDMALKGDSAQNAIEDQLSALQKTLKEEFSFLSKEEGKGHLALASWMDLELDLNSSLG